jgi:hypothetical protein
MNPTLKAPGSKRLKLKYNKLLSSFAFKFNLHRYTKVATQFNQDAAAVLLEEVGPGRYCSPRHRHACLTLTS